MNKFEQTLDAEWGYTGKYGEDFREIFRPLTPEEHELLVKMRQEEALELRDMISHTQETMKLFKEGNPEIEAREIIMIILEGDNDIFMAVEEWLGGFKELRRRFLIGNPFHDGWLVTVEDAIKLEGKFPKHIHFPGEVDISKQLLRTVTPYDWDPADVEGWFKK